MAKDNPDQAHKKPVTRDEVNAALVGVRDMVSSLVNARLKQMAGDDENEELIQKTMISLWEKSIPKFDPSRGVKLSTFLYDCARNFIATEVRSLARAARPGRRIALISQETMAGLGSKTEQHVNIIVEKAAAGIMAHPERHFTARQRTVFRALTKNPLMRRKDLARMLGYKRAGSLSMMIHHICLRLKSVDMEAVAYETRPAR